MAIGSGADRITAEADGLLLAHTTAHATPAVTGQTATTEAQTGPMYERLVEKERRDRRRASLEAHLGLRATSPPQRPMHSPPPQRVLRSPRPPNEALDPPGDHLASIYAELAREGDESHEVPPPFGTPRLRPRVRVRTRTRDNEPAAVEDSDDELWA
jgi:hypothetical protein